MPLGLILNEMFILELVLFIILSVAFIVLVIRNSKKWALALQHLYVLRAVDWFPGSSEDWKDPWIRILFQTIIIFFAVVSALMVFSSIFGTVYMSHDQVGNTSWQLLR